MYGDSVACGESGNWWQFGDCDEPGGGENDGVGEADGGGESGSRSPFKSKLSRLDCCL